VAGYVVFLAGGTASGKSFVARVLEEKGARRIDLDVLSREVLAPHSPLLAKLQAAFGADLVGPDGHLDRALLATRAFVSKEKTQLLEALELPAIKACLEEKLQEYAQDISDREQKGAGRVPCIVEVPLLDKLGALINLADEVVCVVAPYDLRCSRAVARGMAPEDFVRRVAQQPRDEYLVAHATTVLDNSRDEDFLIAQIHAWWNEREKMGWKAQ
jgi:dephospho-CoA kinase